MYLAIVFLPLLGCILAGAIAIVGARGRFPGGEPEPAGEHTSQDHIVHPTESPPGDDSVGCTM